MRGRDYIVGETGEHLGCNVIVIMVRLICVRVFSTEIFGLRSIDDWKGMAVSCYVLLSMNLIDTVTGHITKVGAKCYLCIG